MIELKKNTLLVIFLLSGLSLCHAQEVSEEQENQGRYREGKSGTPIKDKLTLGGNFGLSFGNIDFVDISPRVGYRISERFTTGLGVIFRYRNDKRFSPNLETQDYGGSLFGTYRIVAPFFLMAEFESLQFEVFQPDLSTTRRSFNSFLAGGGMSQPLGGRGSLNVIILYNLSYTAGSLGPYNSPWIIRGGVGFNL